MIQEIEIGGDHVFFVYSVEAVHCDESWLNESGNIDFVKSFFFETVPVNGENIHDNVPEHLISAGIYFPHNIRRKNCQ